MIAGRPARRPREAARSVAACRRRARGVREPSGGQRVARCSPGQIARRDGALIDYLDPLLRSAATLDHAQSAALDRLQRLPTSSPRSAPRAQSTLKRLLVAAGRPARRLPVGRRRSRQELPDGRVLTRRCRSAARRACTSTRSCATCTRSSRTLKREVDPLATVAATHRAAATGSSASTSSTSPTSPTR